MCVSALHCGGCRMLESQASIYTVLCPVVSKKYSNLWFSSLAHQTIHTQMSRSMHFCFAKQWIQLKCNKTKNIENYEVLYFVRNETEVVATTTTTRSEISNNEKMLLRLAIEFTVWMPYTHSDKEKKNNAHRTCAARRLDLMDFFILRSFSLHSFQIWFVFRVLLLLLHRLSLSLSCFSLIFMQHILIIICIVR